MIEEKKYLDIEGVKTFWDKIKDEVHKVPVATVQNDELNINGAKTGIVKTEGINKNTIDETCK